MSLTAGRPAYEIWMGFKIIKILYRLKPFGLLFVYYHCDVTTILELHFRQLLSSKAYLLCVMKCEKSGSHFFSYQSLLLGTSVPMITILTYITYTITYYSFFIWWTNGYKNLNTNAIWMAIQSHNQISYYRIHHRNVEKCYKMVK